MSGSSDANALSEWVTSVCGELGLDEPADTVGIVDMVLNLASDVAHNVSRPGAPVTAFLVGVAAGRADDPVAAARAYSGRVTRLSTSWETRPPNG